MTDIKFFIDKNNRIVGFECLGHTGYDEYGKDVLCATISGVTQSIVLGLKNVCGIKIKFKRIVKDGYIKVELPKDLDENKVKESQILLRTLYETFKDLTDKNGGYSDYISMEVIEDVY